MSSAADTQWITAMALGSIALALAVAAAFIALARRLRQPAVVGEILAGICLGPSLLGLLPHHLPDVLLPPAVRPHLTVAAHLGLLLFMFLLGWELDTKELRGQRRTIGGLWAVSALVPLILGSVLGAGLFATADTVSRPGVRLVEFTLFMGTAMAIAAFPVLARIITDLKLQSTSVGRLALTLATLDDVLAWTLLALVTALVHAAGPGDFLHVLGWGLVYTLVMFAVVRPALARLARLARQSAPQLGMLAAAGALASSYVTAEIGLHPILGAFVFGLVMPRGVRAQALHTAVRGPLESLAKLLLPVYFVVTGMSMDLTALGWTGVLYIFLALTVASIGKAGGVLLAARITRLDRHQRLPLAILMNTRGLTELVILNAGLELGLLSTQLFTAMTIVALITTAATSPLLGLVLRRTSADAALGRHRSPADAAPPPPHPQPFAQQES
ncbi:cation:proton antiporter [Streptomyces purpurogeneiscleroticus]|uniref:cation:proton antiporter n=1 Tax=Streptomyces purpurogeneiscleroticus TaxID=68259 RepID=UPI001CC05CE0|nr:cation:proton antiporter [Streptomyces purpurogeneiscleroticus]MBZ4016051.1 cation/H(+) antiporter [Streptomyces purpurogeneiscleroticus]